MDRRIVTGGRAMRAVALGLAIGAVSGCEDGQNMAFLQSKDDPAAKTSQKRQSTKLIERDVESPEVFQATESGLWDGRPSLGGVWVAHPDVAEPQRVIIRNSANDKFVIGALFRRERDIPGPRIQASSDAASALGMLAGAPVQLNVVALVREEIPTEPVAVDPAEATPTVIAEAAPVEATTLDPAIAGAAAAIDASEPGADGDGTAQREAQPTIMADDTDAKPGKPAFLAGLFGNKNKKQPASNAATPTVIDDAPADTAAVEPDAEPVATPTIVSDTSLAEPTVAEPTVTAGPDTTRPGFLAAVFGKGKKKSADTGAAGTEQLAAASATATGAPLSAIPAAVTPAAVAVAPLPKSSALAKPYIQIGIFSVEENANRTADQMRRAGMVPTVFAQSSSGKSFWRVVVGPAQTKSERTVLLEKVKETGFSDAYYVSK